MIEIYIKGNHEAVQTVQTVVHDIMVLTVKLEGKALAVKMTIIRWILVHCCKLYNYLDECILRIAIHSRY